MTVDKNEVIKFFNAMASSWDEALECNDKVIDKILTNAKAEQGKSVLDVACGTGVLVPYYLERGVSDLTCIDISQNMIEKAKTKFSSNNISFICSDAENYNTNRKYDSIVIYNAFPHFSDPEALIKNLSSQLSTNGILTVAHGMSRQALLKHHNGIREKVSVPLMDLDELVSLFSKYLTVTVSISDDDMFQVCGQL